MDDFDLNGFLCIVIMCFTICLIGFFVFNYFFYRDVILVKENISVHCWGVNCSIPECSGNVNGCIKFVKEVFKP